MKNMEKAVEMEESTCSSSSVEDQGTPLRPIFCLKKKVDLKIFDDIYDCFILDFDPVEPIPSISNLSVSSNDDLSVVAEKGQVFVLVSLLLVCWLHSLMPRNNNNQLNIVI